MQLRLDLIQSFEDQGTDQSHGFWREGRSTTPTRLVLSLYAAHNPSSLYISASVPPKAKPINQKAPQCLLVSPTQPQQNTPSLLFNYFFFVLFTMANMSDLPVLVIYRIIKLVYYNNDEFKGLRSKLPLIAINSAWRQVGLPILYGTLFFNSTPSDPSNIHLYTTKAYKSLVKCVEIQPSRYVNHIFGLPTLLFNYIANLSGLLINNQEPTPSIDSVMDAMPRTLEKLSKMFSNVNAVDLKFPGSDSTTAQFSTSLVEHFRHRLVSLSYKWPGLLDLSFLPPQLTSLHCNFQCKPASQMPKINPHPLKYLYITNPPQDFPLLFTREPDSSILVKFPNLRKLSLICEKVYAEETADSVAQAQKLELHFPKLWLLKLVVGEGNTAFAFNPKTLPAHLEILDIAGTNSAICRLGRELPARSIGHIRLVVDKVFEEDIEDFFNVSNRLLGQTNITHRSGDVKLFCCTERYDMQLSEVKWKDLSKLELVDPRFWYCVYLLDRLPSVKYFSVIYNDRDLRLLCLEENSEGFPVLNRSQLEYLSIDNSIVGDSVEYIVGMSIRLMRSLINLKLVYISKDEASAVWTEFHKERYQYDHYDNIEIRPIL